MKQSETIFSQTDMWAEYGRSADYIERQQLLEKLIAAESQTILDVGCGKGEIINSLQQRHLARQIIGLDASAEALTYVNTPSALALLPRLPFKDAQFDTVLCLQVLEHIPTAIYDASLTELERVASQQIIIGIPFAENLQAKTVICAHCGYRSHVDGHLRRYQTADMQNLFRTFSLKQHYFAGVRQRRVTTPGSRILQGLGGIFYRPQYFVCPHCSGRENKVMQKPLWQRKLAVLLALPFRTITARPYWLIGLYQRKSA